MSTRPWEKDHSLAIITIIIYWGFSELVQVSVGEEGRKLLHPDTCVWLFCRACATAFCSLRQICWAKLEYSNNFLYFFIIYFFKHCELRLEIFVSGPSFSTQVNHLLMCNMIRNLWGWIILVGQIASNHILQSVKCYHEVGLQICFPSMEQFHFWLVIVLFIFF